MKYDLNQKHRVVVPSDVFAAEPSNAAGYARSTVKLAFTAGQTARVGSVIEYDPITMEATLSATGAPVTEGNKIGVFFGRDVLVDPSHFERLVASQALDGDEVEVVIIARGDGSGQISPSFLDFAGTDYYTLTTDQQAAFRALVEQELRLKFIKQQKRIA